MKDFKINITLLVLFSLLISVVGATAFHENINKPRIRGNMLFLGDSYILASSAMSGKAAFTTSATTDVITVAGVTTASEVFVCSTDATPVDDDQLSVVVGSGSFTVHRPAGTTSGLTYAWWRVD